MEDNFSPQQSLQLIQSMIAKTKSNLGANRTYFLLWGWVTFAAIVAQFVLKVALHSERHYLVWLVVFPTIVVTIWYSARKQKERMVTTYIGESMSYLWTGLGVSFLILSTIISNTEGGWLKAWPYFILFYGLGTYVSGKILKFPPLVIGGVVNWVLAVASIFVAFDYQLLLAAAAILTSYIIPGYLLKSKKN